MSRQFLRQLSVSEKLSHLVCSDRVNAILRRKCRRKRKTPSQINALEYPTHLSYSTPIPTPHPPTVADLTAHNKKKGPLAEGRSRPRADGGFCFGFDSNECRLQRGQQRRFRHSSNLRPGDCQKGHAYVVIPHDCCTPFFFMEAEV